MSKKVKVIIAIVIALLGMLIMISKLFDKQQIINTIEQTTLSNKGNKSVSSTNTTTKIKTTKKVVKTTKKVVKQKQVKMNVNASKSEMQNYAHQQVVARWGEEHWNAFYQIVSHESEWNPNLINKKSGACGLFQFVPCSKGGSKYKTDYKVQVQKGIDYITTRYGNPNNAWKFWQKHHWY